MLAAYFEVAGAAAGAAEAATGPSSTPHAAHAGIDREGEEDVRATLVCYSQPVAPFADACRLV